MAPSPILWLLEDEIFSDGHARLRSALDELGMEGRRWDETWGREAAWPDFEGTRVVFHGSLGLADRIARESTWSPGAFCRTDAFRCSAWYDRASPWLLQRRWALTTVEELVRRPRDLAKGLDEEHALFVRPDSPLKPFAGRVLGIDDISLAALAHGFYYDDESLPIIIAPRRDVAREWRYVVVDGVVVAGSAYLADGREALPDDPAGRPWRYAEALAREFEAPEPVYVLDVCESEGELRLVELNPFSGADLYACDRTAIASAIASHLS